MDGMGYDIERFVGEVNEGLLCCICRDVLEDPLQAPCEHAFCSTCIHGWLVHENYCPEDRKVLFPSQLRPLFRYMKNDLARLQIRCRNVEAGCPHITDLEFIANHEAECGYETAECPSSGCTVMLERRDHEEHLKTCKYRTRECPKGCGQPIFSPDDCEHNCIAELRSTIEIQRSEMICKLEDSKQEMELRLDAQRRHMVTRENAMQVQIDELKVQNLRLVRDMKMLMESEKQRQMNKARLEAEKKEIMETLKTLKKDIAEGTKKQMCLHCRKTEKVTIL